MPVQGVGAGISRGVALLLCPHCREGGVGKDRGECNGFGQCVRPLVTEWSV